MCADDFAFLAEALTRTDAAAFVHAGRDADLRYLANAAPDSDWAFCYADGTATLLVPRRDRSRASAAFPGTVRPFDETSETAGSALSGSLSKRLTGSRAVLAPPHVPHDVALYVEKAGHDLVSTTAVTDVRVVKSSPERERLRTVTEAATRAMDRAATILDAAGTDGETLHWQDRPLTAEVLRRRVNAALAVHGASDARSTVVGGSASDPAAADPDRVLGSGVPVVVTVSPCGRDGYHASLGRTFVVDGDGRWARRAQVAVEGAHDAALEAAEVGATVTHVARELTGELAAYGFEADGATVPVHGIGLERFEPPAPHCDQPLESGTALVVAPSVSRGGETVGIADTVVVTGDGPVALTDRPRSLSPSG